MVPKSKGYQSKDDRKGIGNFQVKHDQKLTVTDLVYKYLRKLAQANTVRKQHNCACNRFRRKNARTKSIHSPQNHFLADSKKTKSYIRDAVSFAVRSGYLIPDDSGTILRLSSQIKLNF